MKKVLAILNDHEQTGPRGGCDCFSRLFQRINQYFFPTERQRFNAGLSAVLARLPVMRNLSIDDIKSMNDWIATKDQVSGTDIHPGQVLYGKLLFVNGNLNNENAYLLFLIAIRDEQAYLMLNVFNALSRKKLESFIKSTFRVTTNLLNATQRSDNENDPFYENLQYIHKQCDFKLHHQTPLAPSAFTDLGHGSHLDQLFQNPLTCIKIPIQEVLRNLRSKCLENKEYAVQYFKGSAYNASLSSQRFHLSLTSYGYNQLSEPVEFGYNIHTHPTELVIKQSTIFERELEKINRTGHLKKIAHSIGALFIALPTREDLIDTPGQKVVVVTHDFVTVGQCGEGADVTSFIDVAMTALNLVLNITPPEAEEISYELFMHELNKNLTGINVQIMRHEAAAELLLG